MVSGGSKHRLSIRLFGDFDVRLDGEPVLPPDSHVAERLLAYLVLFPNKLHARRELVEVLWPGSDKSPEDYLVRLRQLLRSLTSLKEAGYLRVTQTAIGLYLGDDAEVDVCQFDAAVERGERGEFAGWEEAVNLYESRGELLEAWARKVIGRDGSEWISEESGKRRDLYLQGLEDLGVAAAKRGDLALARLRLEPLLSIDPEREVAARALMNAHRQAGQVSAAKSVFHRLTRLCEKLDLDGPDEETVRLYESLKEGAAGSPRPSERFIARRGAIPEEQYNLVGRVQELNAITEEVKRRRLVTIVGPGGTGKSRLAVEVATHLVGEYRDAPLFFDLSLVRHSGDIYWFLASTLVREEPQDEGEEQEDEKKGDEKGDGKKAKGKKAPLVRERDYYLRQLIEFFADRVVVLVLDHCDHLLPTCRRFLEELTSSCKGLRILATSRAVLEVEGEALRRLGGLSLPKSEGVWTREDVLNCGGPALFMARAERARAGFTASDTDLKAITRICYRVEGIPLGIVLAAARVYEASVEQIEASLENWIRLIPAKDLTVSDWKRGVNAVMGWSYEMLSSSAQQLLHGLTLFVGGWTFDAAVAVGEAIGLQDDVSEVHAELVKTSWIEVEHHRGSDPRYRLLDPIRQFAEPLLDEAVRDRIRAAQASYYLSLAEDAASRYYGREEAAWLARLDADRENLRNALEWSHGGQRAKLATALYWYWWVRAQFTEGRAQLKLVLDEVLEDTHVPNELKALAISRHVALGHYFEGNLAKEHSKSARLARRLAEQSGNPRVLAEVLEQVSYMHASDEEQDKARKLARKALRLAQDCGDVHREAYVSWLLGWTYSLEEDYTSAKPHFEHARGIAERHGDDTVLAEVYRDLGVVEEVEGGFEAAEGLMQRALAIYAGQRDTAGLAGMYGYLGALEVERKCWNAADEWFRKALELWRELRQVSVPLRGLPVSFAHLASAAGEFEEALILLAAVEKEGGAEVEWQTEAEAVRAEVEEKVDGPSRERALRLGQMLNLERFGALLLVNPGSSVGTAVRAALQ